MRDLLIVTGAIVLVILSTPWWPSWHDWRFNHMLICWNCRRFIWSTWLRDMPGTPRHPRCARKWVMPAWTGPDSPQTPVPVDDDPPSDNEPRYGELGWTERAWREHFGDMRGFPWNQPQNGGSDDHPATADDIWVAELHTINQLGKFGDLTRPVKDLTHYEVEAVISLLGDPWWVPERWRVAA